MISLSAIWVWFEVEVERQMGSGFDLSLGAISLSLSLRVSPEMVWNENFYFKPFSPHITYFTVNTENIFSLTQFSGPTKQPILQKNISEFSLKSKQMEPKFQYAFHYKKLNSWIGNGTSDMVSNVKSQNHSRKSS